MNKSYTTLSEALARLRLEGYTLDFNILDNKIAYHKKNILLSPEEFEINLIYRFEGNSNPDDQSILYGISSLKHNLKGVLVNGYGMSAHAETNKVISKLHLHAN